MDGDSRMESFITPYGLVRNFTCWLRVGNVGSFDITKDLIEGVKFSSMFKADVFTENSLKREMLTDMPLNKGSLLFKLKAILLHQKTGVKMCYCENIC